MAEKEDISNLEGGATYENDVVKTPYGDQHSRADAFVTSGDLPPLDQAVERSLRRKLDIWIMPLMTLNFVFAFVDRYDLSLKNHMRSLISDLQHRSNLGNSKIVGLEADLGMKGFDFNWASTAFVSFYTCLRGLY